VKAPPEIQERLKFLSRVVNKEIKHLDYAASQAFGGSLTYEAVEALDSTPDLAMKVEAFTSRFCRLQDTLEQFAARLDKQVLELVAVNH
jgi:hypothetical protein